MNEDVSAASVIYGAEAAQVGQLQQVYVLETGKLSEYDGELEQLVKTDGQVAGTDGVLEFLEKERDEYSNYR